MHQENKSRLGMLAGIGAGALWGLVFLAPALLPAFQPLELSVGRYLAYGLIAAMLVAPSWRRLLRTLTLREWRGLIWLSLTGNIVYYVLLASAVQMGGRGHDVDGDRHAAAGRHARGQPRPACRAVAAPASLAAAQHCRLAVHQLAVAGQSPSCIAAGFAVRAGGAAIVDGVRGRQ